MAAFCHFWKLTPRDIDDMTPAEYDALVRYQNKWVTEQKRQSARRR